MPALWRHRGPRPVAQHCLLPHPGGLLHALESRSLAGRGLRGAQGARAGWGEHPPPKRSHASPPIHPPTHLTPTPPLQLPLSDKGLKKLSESFRLYKHSLGDEEVSGGRGEGGGGLVKRAGPGTGGGLAPQRASQAPGGRGRRSAARRSTARAALLVLPPRAGGWRHQRHCAEGQEGQRQGGDEGVRVFVLCVCRAWPCARAPLLGRPSHAVHPPKHTHSPPPHHRPQTHTLAPTTPHHPRAHIRTHSL